MPRLYGLPPAHRGTSAQLGALYPFVVPAPLPSGSCYLGQEASGGLFCFDPWDCYGAGTLTNPNMVVLGQIGRGKSAFVKSFLWRQYLQGRQCWALDPKGEYGALAGAVGAVPLRLGPGLGLRLNPLDLGSHAQDQGHRGGGQVPGTGAGGVRSAHQRRSELLGALLASSLGRQLLPAERAAVDVALAATEALGAVPTLGQVAHELMSPGPGAARDLGTDVEGLRTDGRQVALELRRLVHGDLAGMFDGPSSPGAGLGQGMVVLDLSALYSSPALGLLMVCALGWLQSAMGGAGQDGTRRVVVADEAWAVLSHLPSARWLQATFKLARSYGVANVAVVHRASDLQAGGAGGSEQQRLAQGLLADAETRVVFGQAPGEAAQAAALLGLSHTEQLLVGRLPRGAALWLVGERRYLVRHMLSERERLLVDTDGAMRARAGGPGRAEEGTAGARG